MTKSPKTTIAASCALALVVAITISLLTSTLAAISCVLLFAGGAYGALGIAKDGRLPKAFGPNRAAWVFASALALFVSAATALIDNSWVSLVATTVAALVVALIWLSLFRQFAPAPALASATKTALANAGATLLSESVAGWHIATTPNGASFLIREVASSPLEVPNWPSVAKALESLEAPLRMMKSQGVTPKALAVATEGFASSERVGELIVCSPSKLTGIIRQAAPEIDVAKAAEQGLIPSRQVARAMTKAAPQTKSNSSKKITHNGRVTKSAKQ